MLHALATDYTPMDEQQGKFDLWTLFYGSYPPTPKKILNYAIFLPQHY